MSLDLARDQLLRLLRRWRRARAGAASLTLAAAAAFGWALAARLPLAGALALAAGAGLGALVWVFRGESVGLADIARHLDRSLPELEESAELILADPEALSPLERLQQVRVAERARSVEAVRLPRGPFVRAAAASAAISAASVLAVLLPPPGTGPARDASRPGRPPILGDANITVRPPLYTHLPLRSSGWELDVESGATVSWRVRVADAERVSLVRLPADTLRLRREGARWTAALGATTPAVYQLIAENAAGRASGPLHRLGVRPDQPPSLEFTQPVGRTTLDAGAPRRVRIAARASDDYGIAQTFLLVTVASGAGEQVKFRERRLPLEATSRDTGRSLALGSTLDLGALGMGPGDEAYLTAVARDARAPTAQEGRSETVIVAIADTGAAAVADFAGLPSLVRPAHLRGQRQIILDTERLLAERARITRDDFRTRAIAIGDDQRLLRLRYAELLGGETVGDAGDRSTADPGLSGESLTHEHDTEENATLLSPEVKLTLTAAVAQMWEAERSLRTFEPRAALPHELGALERLKEVQRAGRVYVRRTGAEPPALDLTRRLTGELKGAGASSETVAQEPAVTLPAARAALVALGRMQSGAGADASSRAALAAAVDEIAARAAAGSAAELGALRALRGVLDSLEAQGRCGGCLAIAARQLWALLPPAEASPAAPEPPGRVGQAYLDLLARER
jgi:hypothetical protein